MKAKDLEEPEIVAAVEARMNRWVDEVAGFPLGENRQGLSATEMTALRTATLALLRVAILEEALVRMGGEFEEVLS